MAWSAAERRHRDDAGAARRARHAAAARTQLNAQLEHELRSRCASASAFTSAKRSSAPWGRRGSQIVTAIGDTVNTAARLESLTKDYDCPLIVSRQAAAAAGVDLSSHPLHRTSVKGRVGTVEFYALPAAPAVSA